MDERIEQEFKALYDMDWEGYTENPYWLDQAREGDIVEHVIPKGLNTFFQRGGIMDNKDYGDTVKGNELGEPAKNNKKYEYVNSTSGPSELEIPKENGLSVKYAGSNFFRIWRPVEKTNKYSGEK